MKKKRRLELIEKGWTERELRKAEKFMEHDVQQSTSFSRVVFWSALIVIIFANLTVSLIVVPFLIVFSATILYFMMILLGVSFGFLYNHLITSVGEMHKSHHFWTNILVPIIAIVNLVIMFFASHFFISKLESHPITQNPLTAGIVFAIAFVVPYAILKLLSKKS
ncbi:hypothetical protein COV12_02015 [Candidatus Woesearchaeota archaeon CG10_big_fil_rev_8_21_14_0_10_32_24]|nr:MAG: hypothetical protein COV12_02015 [Candidatus Woesearchaeota archaeon CG10_big_fil_rev_8_21_14_0_10_32_24]